MPYVGGSLTSLFGKEAQAETRVALRRMAEKGGDRMVEVTVLNTPIRTGNLRTSWYQIPVSRTHFGPWPAYRSGVATDVDYAPDVEYGTGLWGPQGRKYEIRPKDPTGWLRWVDPKTGQEVFAKRVMHPGSPGNHMVAIAASVVEFEADTMLFEPVLADWSRAIEAGAD